jgi:DnaK suppressor protein
MATKAKTPAKSAGAHKAAAKPAAKSAKPAHKPAAKPAPKSVKPVAKAAAKPVPAKKPVKAPASSARSAAKPEAVPAKLAKPGAKSAAKDSGHATPVPSASASAAQSITLPPPKPPVRQVQAVSEKELATAHEYLLTRSAGRSGEAVLVDGKPLLTEEQLLSMSESEYMNAEQLAFFRYRLQQMERELLSNADETTEHLRETVIVPDPADRATIEEEHALELRTRDRERKLLKKVQGSLAQIESGDYGYCEETGDPIGIPRLLARPTATLSLEAQQRREIKQKLFGD